MQDSADPTLAQDRRNLPLNQQPYTAHRLQALIDDPEDQALMVGPILFQRDRWARLRGSTVFLVPAGVELLVERDGQVSQVLRNGRFDADTWPASESIRFFLIRTGARTLRMAFESEPHGAAPTLRALTLRYRVSKWEQLISHARPLAELYSQVRARLQPALYLTSQDETTRRVNEILAVLSSAPDIAALGLAVSGGVVERWVAARPPGPSAFELLSDQVSTLRNQQYVVDFREERGAYYVVVPLVSHINDDQTLIIYCACTAQYPAQAPVVFVRSLNGAEEPYIAPLLEHWTPRNTLIHIVDAVKRDYEQP